MWQVQPKERGMTFAQAKEMPLRPEGPQPLLRDIVPGDPYPVAALGPLRAAVEAVQGTTLAPMTIAARSALAVAFLERDGFWLNLGIPAGNDF